MSGHTPGPWTVRAAPYGWDIFVSDIATDRALWIASITTGLLGIQSPYYPSKEECEANARLIASAPDLLAALLEAGLGLDGKSQDVTDPLEPIAGASPLAVSSSKS